jgi:hypothetical protein
MITKYPAGYGVAERGPARRLAHRLRSIAAWLVIWVDTRVDHWAAVEVYRQLTALSDAELARRGLSRVTLAHDVLAATHADPRPAGGELQWRELTQEGLAQDAADTWGRRRRRAMP